MISAISPYSSYSTYGLYGASYANRSAQARGADKAQAAQAQAQSAQRSGMAMTARKAAQPETPVQPVTPTRAVGSQEDPAQAGLLRFGSDPAEMAVRMRIQYPGEDQQGTAQSANAEKTRTPDMPGAKDGAAQPADAEKTQTPNMPGAKNDTAQPVGGEEKTQTPAFPNAKDDGNAAEAANADKAQMPDLPGSKAAGKSNPGVGDSKSPQEVMEEGECETCKERKYQDGSDDPGVSFKTPTNISPEQAASAVRGHENEHVVREQAKARQEDRKVVSQSVSYRTDICPECGKVYVSGGTTRTVTKADNSQEAEQQNRQNQQQNQQQDPRKPFIGVA